MGSGEQGIGRGKKIGTGDVRRAGRIRISLGEILYESEGFQRKKPNIRTVKRKVPSARGESDGSRGTPGDVIDAGSEGDGDTI
jgi:hypothetical protein